MLRNVKPKTARGKRALEKREPKVVEDVKNAVFMKAANCSQVVSDVMKDLVSLTCAMTRSVLITNNE